MSCHTNIACDNVIDQFIKYEHEETVKNLVNNGEIIRIGTPVLQDPRIKDLTIEAIHERLNKELGKEMEGEACLAHTDLPFPLLSFEGIKLG